MAEKIEIIDSSNAKKQLDILLKSLEQIERKILDLSKSFNTLGNSISSIKSITDLEKRLAKLEGTQEKTNKQMTEAEKTAKKLATAKIKLANVTSKENVELQKTNATIAQTNRQLRGVATSTKEASTGFLKLGMSIKQAFSRFLGFTVISTLLFGFMRALKDTAQRVVEFDKTMTNLAAILNTSRANLKGLEETIKNVAGASIKTSNEVAKLAETLIVLGKSKNEVQQLLKPVNDLSIGLESTSQEAGELLIMTMNAFGAAGDEAQKYADIIAKMRTSSALDFQRIKDSLAFLAPVANVAGKSFEEAASMLSVLVDNGIKASKAGRLTAASFLRLSKEGKTLEDAMEGINEAIKEGKTEVELTALATELFGVNSAAVGIILSKNKDRMAELTEEYENSKGTLKELTDIQLESLRAKMTIMDSTWEKFVLNVENGNGAIANFSKGVITLTTNSVSFIDAASQTSDGFFEFWLQMARGAQLGGMSMVVLEAEMNRIQEERILLATELVELINKQALATGFGIDKEQEMATQLNKTTDEIRAYIEELNNRKKAEDGYEDELDNRRELKDVLSDITDQRRKLQTSTADEAIAILDVIDVLEKEKDAWERSNKKAKEMISYIKDSVGWLEQMIAAKNKLIKQSKDRSEIEKYQEEIKLLEQKRQLLLQGERAIVTAVDGERAGSQGVLGGGLAGTGLEQDKVIATDFEKGVYDIGEFVDKYADQINQGIDATNMFFDNKIERLEQDREANDEYYDALIDAAGANSEEQDRLRQEKERKDKILREKQNKAAKEQAIINRGLAVFNIALSTSEAIAASLAVTPLPAGLPFVIANAALGAAQIAAVVSAPYPKFKDGTDNAPSGFAVVGDGGKHEYIDDGSGRIIQTPNTDTLVNLRGGEKIYKDVDALSNAKGYSTDDIYKATILTSLASERRLSNDRLEKVFDKNLVNLDKKIMKGIQKGFNGVSMHNHNNIDVEWAKYVNDTL